MAANYLITILLISILTLGISVGKSTWDTTETSKTVVILSYSPSSSSNFQVCKLNTDPLACTSTPAPNGFAIERVNGSMAMFFNGFEASVIEARELMTGVGPGPQVVLNYLEAASVAPWLGLVVGSNLAGPVMAYDIATNKTHSVGLMSHFGGCGVSSFFGLLGVAYQPNAQSAKVFGLLASLNASDGDNNNVLVSFDAQGRLERFWLATATDGRLVTTADGVWIVTAQSTKSLEIFYVSTTSPLNAVPFVGSQLPSSLGLLSGINFGYNAANQPVALYLVGKNLATMEHELYRADLPATIHLGTQLTWKLLGSGFGLDSNAIVSSFALFDI